MALLLYKSDEMFSSTELIRKSKMIFDKVINQEIEKAIILRDGKPGFLLMDFKKYEDIMGEYEMLKEYVKELETKVSKQKEKKKKLKTPKKEKKQEIVEIADDTNIQEQNIEINEPIKDLIEDKTVVKKSSAMVVPPRPKAIVAQDNTEKEIDDISLDNNEHNLNPILDQHEEEEETTQPQELSLDEEVKQAFESIKSMNFDDNMRQMAEKKIRERILIARQEREKLLEDQIANEKDDLKKELELQVHIKEENKKKEEELKEFWD